MNSASSIWLIHRVLLFVLGLSLLVRGTPIGPIQPPARGLSFPTFLPILGLLGEDIAGTSGHTNSITSTTSTSTSAITSSSSSSTDQPSSSTEASTSSTGGSRSSTQTTTPSIAVSTSSTPAITTSVSSASTSSITAITNSTTKTTVSGSSETAITTTSSMIPTTTTSSSPSSSPSSTSNNNRQTLVIALSVTFSILGAIALALIFILLLQCTKSSPQYQRFRLRCFPFSRGGATPLSDNEIATWREKPPRPPGSEPNAYANLIQRYSRPLSMTRPLNTSQALLLQGNQAKRPSRLSGLGGGLVRPAVPPKLNLSSRNGNGGQSSAEIHEETNTIPLGTRDRAQRSAPLPPIARAPNSRPGLTDESLPGTPAFILPTHPRRVSRKLSKTNHRSAFSPQSLTSPSTPRPSTSNTRKPNRRKSMPGLNSNYHDRRPESLRWPPRKYEEDQVVQRGSLGLSSHGKGVVVHSRSQSDMTPFKEAMEGRSRPSPGIRPSFEESMGKVKEEAPS